MEKGKDNKPVISTLVRSLLQGEDEPIFDATAFYDWDYHFEVDEDIYVEDTDLNCIGV